MVITGAFDGPLTGGSPKVIEIYVINNIADLSTFGVGSANNGGGTDGEELTFAGTANAGDFIYVVYEATAGDFNNYFGLTADYLDAVANVNGDDALELFNNGSVIDTFGDINLDGTGQPWEYLDGWAYRNNSTGPDGSSFVLSNWSFSNPNATDGCTTNGTCGSQFPIGSFVYSGTPCGVSFGAISYICNASTTGDSDSVTINIAYTGSDNTLTALPSTSSGGTVGGDDPSSVADGTITISGLSEGDAWDITLNGGNCDGFTTSGTVSSVECLPTPCYDLTGSSNQFDIVQITANDDTDNWSLSTGEYYINGFCPSCTNVITDSWLIFGALDMSSSVSTELVFNATEGFSGSDLVVFYSESYTGSPDTTSWTTLQTITTGSSGYYNISIPSTGSSVYLGIQYLDGDGTYSSWTLANAGVYATSCPTLGISDFEASNFKIYPNPTSLGYVNLKSRNGSAFDVSVYDVLGKQVIKSSVTDGKLDVSSLNTGLYIMKISQEEATVTKKLVIK